MNTPQLTPLPSFWSTVLTVAKREIKARFLSKSFLISTLITLLVVFGILVLIPKMDDFFEGGDKTIAVTAETAPKIDALGDGFETLEVEDEAAAREAVESEDADAAVVATADSPLGLKILTLDEAPTALMGALSVSPEVELIEPDAPDPFVFYMLGLGFGMMWMMSALTYGLSIAQSVVEEKETRIVEILLATVSPRALLTGKILGNSIAAFVQVLLIAGVAMIGFAINGDALPVKNMAAPVTWFVVLFVVGFVMIAALYAAAAALVSRQEDLANVQQPIMWIIMIPYMLVLFLFNNPIALKIMSYVPFSAPVAVPIRVYAGDGFWWEPLISLALLALTTALIIGVAAKIYANGLLRTGKALKWREALKADA